MKTIIATTCYLDQHDYLLKTIKFCNYYNRIKDHMNVESEIVLFDNHSSTRNIGLLQANVSLENSPLVRRFDHHLGRTSHLEYPYLYRAVYHFQELFNQGYEKIIYMDNDFYLLSPEATNYVKNFKSGWASFYCNKHKFPETGIQIITKDCKEYWNMVQGLSKEEFINKYNGQMMETTLPLTEVNRSLIGDRYSEYDPVPPQDEKMDWSAQARVIDQFVYGMKT